MTAVAAHFFDGRSAQRRDVQVEIDGGGRVRVTGLEEPREYPLADVAISSRIGRTPRILRFPDGASCEVMDNDAIDAALKRLDAMDMHHGVHTLESRWTYALGALVAVVVVVWAGIMYGIPALAGKAAMAFPASTDQALGYQAMQILDKSVFKPSKLSPGRQAQLKQMFNGMVRELDDGHSFRLELRTGGPIGANAFALPSGIVVMTDELVNLSDKDRELQAVLAHEIGHVVHRHSLRMLLQNSAVGLLSIAVLGDLTSVSTLVATVPTVLVQAKHSRTFEREADDFAYTWLDKHNVPHSAFASILRKLEAKYGEGKKNDPMSWLSTHPKTAERIRK